MEKNQKTYGRTLYDLIGENPKATFFLFLLILLGAVVLLLLNVPFKIGNLQFGATNEARRDTLIKHDTIYVTKFITKGTLNQKADTQTTININSYNQSGGQTANEITNNK